MSQDLGTPVRTLRLLGEATHAETQVAGTIASHDVEPDVFDLEKIYQRAYLSAVYTDSASDSVDSPAVPCPCNSTL